ncbi:hypothetical protein QJS10_CPA07g00031 [Acorus calamus]|uniref:Reverse transcriptase zinc-binding domain-containing protein n=1 Tax=Acorus calamus TaxID=4465 RepID=A0AAV9EJ48_ACOCL|nr:hypothetical protein QJS10_CPA07g00031 [Acorus calamus]
MRDLWEATTSMKSNRGKVQENTFTHYKTEDFETQNQEGVQDEVIWRPQPRLSFSVRGCYDWWRRDLPRFETTTVKAAEIWRPKIPLKEKLLTRVYRAKWVLDADTRCPLCEMEEETVLHLFIDCPFARQLWRLLKGATGMEDQFSSLTELWEAGRRLRSKGDRSVDVRITTYNGGLLVRFHERFLIMYLVE